MKGFRCILVVLFSALIVWGGVGIAVISYCCSGCEMARHDCHSGCACCDSKPQADAQSQQGDGEEGCRAVYYKVDLSNLAHEPLPLLPLLTFCCELLPYYYGGGEPSLQACRYEEGLFAPPPPIGARSYLALYSTLLI